LLPETHLERGYQLSPSNEGLKILSGLIRISGDDAVKAEGERYIRFGQMLDR
jgi:hypothetical protein